MDVLDVAGVAQLLRCSEYTVRDRAKSGDLPGLKFGDDWIFPVVALLERLNSKALAEATGRRTTPTPAAVQFAAPVVTQAKGRKPNALPASLQALVAGAGSNTVSA